jgi:hypothetical protein
VILTHAKDFCDKNGPRSSPYFEKLKLKLPDFYNKFSTTDLFFLQKLTTWQHRRQEEGGM